MKNTESTAPARPGRSSATPESTPANTITVVIWFGETLVPSIRRVTRSDRARM